MIDILYIEDNADDADIFSRLVKKLERPIDFTILNSASAAIDYFSGEGQYRNQVMPMPKVVLLDLNLVGMSGFDLLAWFRSTSRTRWLLVVAFSTSDNPSDIRRAYESGANAYIVKPGSYQETGALVQRICQFWLEDNTRMISHEQLDSRTAAC